jgi:hypothetical protein
MFFDVIFFEIGEAMILAVAQWEPVRSIESCGCSVATFGAIWSYLELIGVKSERGSYE